MNASELTEFNSIRHWLNGDKNFTRGFLLLSAYSDNHTVVDSLKRFPEDSLLFSQLKTRYDRLKAMYDATTEETTPVEVQTVNDKKVIKHVEIFEQVSKIANEVTAIVTATKMNEGERKKQQIQQELKAHFKHRSLWHSELQALTYHLDGSPKKKLTQDEETKAFETAKLLVELQEKIEVALNHLDYYAIHGNFPQTAYKQRVKKAVPLSHPEAILKLKNNVAPQHSKLKTKIAKAKEELPTAMGKSKVRLLHFLAKWQPMFEQLDAEKSKLEKLIHGK